MERAVAIKKLTKLLGKSLGYRVDPKAPDQDDRDEARAKLKELGPKRNSLADQMEARRIELLKNDAEYQRLKTAHAEIKKECENLLSISSRYRFTAGVMTSMFFMVKAQGDSWEEVIAKIERERVAA